MLNYISYVLERVQHLTGLLQRLLGPPGSPCLTCGTHGVLSLRYPEICARCVQQIPWIRTIRCQRCGRGVGCPDCVRPHMQNRSFVCNRSAVQYNDLIKDWISMYKFRGHERYAPLLAALLHQAFLAMSEELSHLCEKETKQLPWYPDAVTYVPVSGERLTERGFNQAERLAARLAAAVRLPILDLLQRQINTAKQSFKSRAERFETMKHVFSIKPEGIHSMIKIWIAKSRVGTPNDIAQEMNSTSFDKNMDTSIPISPELSIKYNKPFQLLLIDDIYTTGSTLDACGHVILEVTRTMGIRVDIYTLSLARS